MREEKVKCAERKLSSMETEHQSWMFTWNTREEAKLPCTISNLCVILYLVMNIDCLCHVSASDVVMLAYRRAVIPGLTKVYECSNSN